MPDAPPEILDALSCLNVHARAHGFGKKAIYAYKTFAAAEFATEARPVTVQVKCHHCSGTGTYRDWNGYDRGRCYRCTRGIATLRFVESVIGPYRWHHPYQNSGHEVLGSVWAIASIDYPREGSPVATLSDGTTRPISFVQAEGWSPNMPGAERLPTDEACRLLNLVEDWIQRVPVWRIANRWTIGRARTALTRYRIDLERGEEDTCCACGSADVLPQRCCGLCSQWRGGWATFARRMCEPCHGGPSCYRWPEAPAPASLTPHVLAWLGRPERQVPFRHEESAS